MSDFVKYSRGLMDAAKGFRSAALTVSNEQTKQALLGSALLYACSFLEAHLNYIAEHFSDKKMFSLHEKGVLLEREVRFESGAFVLSNTLKISRITDRIDLLLAKCCDDPVSVKLGWYSDLTATLKARNAIVHPKDQHDLTEGSVTLALNCVLSAVDALYLVVFKKALPYAKKGIDGGLDIYAK